MSYPVTTLRTTENVGRIVDILKKEGHVGFPVVDNYDPDAVGISYECMFNSLSLLL